MPNEQNLETTIEERIRNEASTRVGLFRSHASTAKREAIAFGLGAAVLGVAVAAVVTGGLAAAPGGAAIMILLGSLGAKDCIESANTQKSWKARERDETPFIQISGSALMDSIRAQGTRDDLSQRMARYIQVKNRNRSGSLAGDGMLAAATLVVIAAPIALPMIVICVSLSALQIWRTSKKAAAFGAQARTAQRAEADNDVGTMVELLDEQDADQHLSKPSVRDQLAKALAVAGRTGTSRVGEVDHGNSQAKEDLSVRPEGAGLGRQNAPVVLNENTQQVTQPKSGWRP